MKGPPQGPRLHIDIPRVQLLIEDKEGIKQLGKHRTGPVAWGGTWASIPSGPKTHAVSPGCPCLQPWLENNQQKGKSPIRVCPRALGG